MTVSKRWTSDKTNIVNTLRLYRSRKLLTSKQIAKQLGNTPQSIMHIINTHMPEAEQQALKAMRYSVSKLGSKNPMKGKFAQQHHLWKGQCDDGNGYFTIKPNGKRIFVHHYNLLPLLGIKKLPRRFVVHHIDGDPHNNDPDNLALVTHKGHKTIHALQRRGGKEYRLRQLKLAEAMKYMTSP